MKHTFSHLVSVVLEYFEILKKTCTVINSCYIILLCPTMFTTFQQLHCWLVTGQEVVVVFCEDELFVTVLSMEVTEPTQQQFFSIIRLSCTCYVCISHHQGRNDIQSYRHGTLTTSTYISCTHSFMVLFCLKSRGCKYTVQEDLCQYGSHHPTSHKTLEACQVKKTGLLFLSLLFKATV